MQGSKFKLMELIQVNQKAEVLLEIDKKPVDFFVEIKGSTQSTVLVEISSDKREILNHLRIDEPIELRVYSYSGIVVLSSTIKNIQLPDHFTITYPKEKKRIQRREYFRVSVQRPIEIFYQDEFTEYNVKGITIDLSGGGVRFSTKEYLQPGFMAELKLYCGDLCNYNEPINAKGRILYSKIVDSKFATKNTHIGVVNFHTITPKERQLILQACFKIQTINKQKGLV